MRQLDKPPVLTIPRSGLVSVREALLASILNLVNLGNEIKTKK